MAGTGARSEIEYIQASTRRVDIWETCSFCFCRGDLQKRVKWWFCVETITNDAYEIGWIHWRFKLHFSRGSSPYTVRLMRNVVRNASNSLTRLVMNRITFDALILAYASSWLLGQTVEDIAWRCQTRREEANLRLKQVSHARCISWKVMEGISPKAKDVTSLNGTPRGSRMLWLKSRMRRHLPTCTICNDWTL